MLFFFESRIIYSKKALLYQEQTQDLGLINIRLLPLSSELKKREAT